ncbi:ADP-ribose pyrophosphatase YjhB, NUDIX family [Haloechinothrix alba]|uniref:ADP-ribose pyrophosphatase YjhB, NUDIX family n=1 Tax=Haloechinothrix alba TaxID=664784 RepID=A0A239APG3_9PSEU|nr:NUDIX domain-containing protein [Haloechinothrix alba]SNR97182.1 ADP-ribose pyrophosphatase YjhB, NUDIX family [Haloechinothrix alba]
MTAVNDLPRHSVSVTGIVVRGDGRILAIQREDDQRWVPPGGVLELNETPEQCVVREVREETGVLIQPDRLTGIYKNMRLGVVSLAFRCTPIDGTAHTSAEATSVAWIDPAEAARMMPPARGIRVTDALADAGPYVRVHDGTDLLDDADVAAITRPTA